MLLRPLKYVGVGLLSIGILLFLYALSATVLSLIPTSPQVVNCHQKSQIFVASNGIHLDLILPRTLVNHNLLEQIGPPASASYMVFGWGDKDFYINTPTWDDFRLSNALRALFTKGQSAVHVVWLQKQIIGLVGGAVVPRATHFDQPIY